MAKETRSVYLVGSKSSNKSNQYLAVAGSYDEAKKLLSSIPAATHIREKQLEIDDDE